MNDNEKDKDFEEPLLKMENEEPVLRMENQDTTGKEPEVVIDAADITIIDDGSNDTVSPAGFPTQSFNPGDIIFKEGDSGNQAYLILSGQVKITRQYKKKRMALNQLGEGQIFGEMAIITGEPRTATAEAIEPTEVFIITEDKLNENLSQHLAIVKSLIDQLIDRLKQLLKQQSTMLGKIERSLLVDKKIEKIKAQANAYEQTKPPGEMEEGVKAMIQLIREI